MLRDRLVKIGAKIVRHGRSVIFQMTDPSERIPCRVRGAEITRVRRDARTCTDTCRRRLARGLTAAFVKTAWLSFRRTHCVNIKGSEGAAFSITLWEILTLSDFDKTHIA